MKVLVLDGHPGEGRLTSHLLDRYAAALPTGATVTRVAVRDLAFDPVLRDGYRNLRPWEPDLAALARSLEECDHLVVGFPLWWGAEPAPLKGLIDRLLLPGFAMRYHRDDPFWERLLAGRSADVIVSMDTPPAYLRFLYGDPVGRRWRRQILGFCGFAPIRLFRLGPTRRGGTARNLAAWEARLVRAAETAANLRRGERRAGSSDAAALAEALAERRS